MASHTFPWNQLYSARASGDPSRPVTYPAVERDSSEYNMNHPNRGKCLVFFFSSFSPKQNLKKRNFAVEEKDMIATAFSILGFDVETHHNLTKEELMRTLNSVSREDHSKRDCLAVVFISHGRFDDEFRKRRLCLYDSEIFPEDLWKWFTGSSCLSLAGKPKMFFIQAGGGREAKEEQFIRRTKILTLALPVTTDNIAESYVLPSCADILMMWASLPGDDVLTSTIGGMRGGVFIIMLSKVLQEKGSEHSLASLLLEVTRNVALECDSCVSTDSEIDARMRVPRTESTLLRHLYFKPKTN